MVFLKFCRICYIIQSLASWQIWHVLCKCLTKQVAEAPSKQMNGLHWPSHTYIQLIVDYTHIWVVLMVSPESTILGGPNFRPFHGAVGDTVGGVHFIRCMFAQNFRCRATVGGGFKRWSGDSLRTWQSPALRCRIGGPQDRSGTAMRSEDAPFRAASTS